MRTWFRLRIAVRGHPNKLRLPLLVRTRFQVLFHSPHRGSFRLSPHGTGSLSVSQEYLALEDGPPIFKQDFSCPALLNMLTLMFQIQDYHLLRSAFPRCSSTLALIGFSPFARRY